MHQRLMMPISILDPLSNLLKQLPTRLPRSAATRQSWTVRWTAMNSIVCFMNLTHLHHVIFEVYYVFCERNLYNVVKSCR
ncbi:hypothetical protein BDF20DRAFT_829668 [Mycotypha africana]|uniref:uncharacterized protein n=1 Tax=Mycotypha africana TaxID=64632 RepID=UPI002300B8CA|nr:uncharacterized protein BDF20DRAFT_829668 [Mycotypha africana]KAI8967369.1 hypothetical protein BDF20DRAFT_829668 [Mycotypha africana]